MTTSATIDDTRRSLENLRLEQDAIVLYDSLARVEKDPRRAAAFRHIARNERRHAEVWADKLRAQGVQVPEHKGPRPRVRLIIALARLFGTGAVAELVQALEGDEEDIYDAQGATPEVASIAADEREHAEIWRRLGRDRGTAASTPHRTHLGRRAGSPTPDVAADALDPGAHSAARIRDEASPDAIARRESWHRSARSGTLRAIIFGVSDGLVSNLSLVMGVAGAASPRESHFILLAGIAGLLAGAFSMAAGEYISMQSQRELFERQIELERAELEAVPEEERAELAALYRAKGFEAQEAERIAARLFEDTGTALDALVREELGLDPDELGSPWGAAAGSFAAFALGAAVPVLPYVVSAGTIAFIVSLGLSLGVSFAVGAGVSLLTGRGLLFSAGRQVAIGAAAAAVTYAVGSIIGVSVGG